MVFCCSILEMLGLVVAHGVVAEFYRPPLKLALEWVFNAFAAGLLATMIVGTVDGQSPGAARSLMPVYCLLLGGLLLWIAGGSVDAVSEISSGRVGAIYVVLGFVLVAANLLRVTRRTR